MHPKVRVSTVRAHLISIGQETKEILLPEQQLHFLNNYYLFLIAMFSGVLFGIFQNKSL